MLFRYGVSPLFNNIDIGSAKVPASFITNLSSRLLWIIASSPLFVKGYHGFFSVSDQKRSRAN